VELVAFVSVLWHHRVAVAVGAVLAVALGVLAMQGSSSRLGVASASVVLDTPSSQLIDAAPLGADTLASRAALLGDLLGSDSLRPRIAETMRLPQDKVAVTAPYRVAPPIATPLPERALEAAAITPEPYVLAVQSPTELPVIAIDASAPSRADAERLVKVAIEVLAATASEYAGRPDIQPFVVESLRPVRSRDIVDDAHRIIGAGVAMVAFAFWCALVAIMHGVRRALRSRAGIQQAAFHRGLS
jgi:hypothetical protein